MAKKWLTKWCNSSTRRNIKMCLFLDWYTSFNVWELMENKYAFDLFCWRMCNFLREQRFVSMWACLYMNVWERLCTIAMLSVLVHDYGTVLIVLKPAGWVAKADSYAFVDDRVVWGSIDKNNLYTDWLSFPKFSISHNKHHVELCSVMYECACTQGWPQFALTAGNITLIVYLEWVLCGVTVWIIDFEFE